MNNLFLANMMRVRKINYIGAYVELWLAYLFV